MGIAKSEENDRFIFRDLCIFYEKVFVIFLKADRSSSCWNPFFEWLRCTLRKLC